PIRTRHHMNRIRPANRQPQRIRRRLHGNAAVLSRNPNLSPTRAAKKQSSHSSRNHRPPQMHRTLDIKRFTATSYRRTNWRSEIKSPTFHAMCLRRAQNSAPRSTRGNGATQSPTRHAQSSAHASATALNLENASKLRRLHKSERPPHHPAIFSIPLPTSVRTYGCFQATLISGVLPVRSALLAAFLCFSAFSASLADTQKPATPASTPSTAAAPVSYAGEALIV